MTVRRTGGALAAAACCAAAPRASSADDIDSELFRPTPAIRAESFQIEPADVGADGEWTATTLLSYAANPVTIDTSVGGSSLSTSRPVTHRAMLELGGAYAFLDRFEAGIRAPLFMQSGDASMGAAFSVEAADGIALGDVSAHGRARLLRTDLVTVSAALHITLPTSSAGQFVGVDGPSARLLALTSVRPVRSVAVTANAGAIVRGRSTYTNTSEDPAGGVTISQGSGAAWGLGVALRATNELRVTGELFGEIVSGESSTWMAPIDALLGIRYQLDSGLSLGLAIGRGVTSSLGTPEARGVLALAFTPSRRVATRPDEDDDGETIEVTTVDTSHLKAIAADSRDRCPTQAEDIDGFEDEDGCPDTDNDGDAIADAQDKCPDRAEVINGIDDNDGCPDEGGGTIAAVSGTVTPMQAAEQTFRQGRELMKARKFAQACAAFEQSQRLDPQFGTQFNIAGCYVEMGKLAAGWTLFRELARADKNVERRQQAQDAAAKLAGRVPKLQLTASSSPPGMTVYMNGVDASAFVGLDNPVDFGTYELVAGAPGHRSWRKIVHIKDEGTIIRVRIQLEPVTP